MPNSNPAPPSAKHPLLRMVGRQALSVAAEEHAADLAEWQQRLVALDARLAASGAPPDWRWATSQLLESAKALQPAEPWDSGLDRVIAGYRRLLKLVIGWETADSWQSPAVAASGSRQRAAHQEPVLAFQNDYQRYALPLRPAETALQALHLPIGEIPPRSWLFGSGMGALATLLQALQAEPGPWLVGSQLYFESQRLLQDHPAEQIDETRPQEVLAAIRRRQPTVVVLDGLANSSRLPALDLGDVLQAMTEIPGQTVRTLLVDTTLLGPGFEPADWLQGRSLPDHLRLVTYRSLQKLDQYGLDLTTGGEVTVWSQRPWHLEGWRQLCGALPTEIGLASLPLPDRTAWLNRFARLERNTALFAAWLGEQRSRWLSGVTVAERRQLGGHVGPLFWADWAEALEAADAQRFCQRLVETAESQSVALAYGSSFGFATTRVAAFTRSGGTGTALRIAPGVENLARLARVADVFQATLADFGHHLAEAYRQEATTTWYRRWRDAERCQTADLASIEACQALAGALSPLVKLGRRCPLDPALLALGAESHQRLIAPLAGRLADTVARDGQHAEALKLVAEQVLALEQALSPPSWRWWQR
jgi:hypothetical protein